MVNIDDSPTLFLGGYMQDGILGNLVLAPPRSSLREAEQDARCCDVPDWRVVLEVEITHLHGVK